MADVLTILPPHAVAALQVVPARDAEVVYRSWTLAARIIQRSWRLTRALDRAKKCPLVCSPGVDFFILFDFELFDCCPLVRQSFLQRCCQPLHLSRRYTSRFDEIMKTRFDLRGPNEWEVPALVA